MDKVLTVKSLKVTTLMFNIYKLMNFGNCDHMLFHSGVVFVLICFVLLFFFFFLYSLREREAANQSII